MLYLFWRLIFNFETKILLYRGTINGTLKGKLILIVYSHSVLGFLILVHFNWRTLFFKMQKLLYHGTIMVFSKARLILLCALTLYVFSIVVRFIGRVYQMLTVYIDNGYPSKQNQTY